MSLTEVKVAKLPKCDFCNLPAKYDGKTLQGYWAYMCEAHHRCFGVLGLGIGKGQRLIVKGQVKRNLVEENVAEPWRENE